MMHDKILVNGQTRTVNFPPGATNVRTEVVSEGD
jgi:hypothetical protein